jgi:hypothetical protein
MPAWRVLAVVGMIVLGTALAITLTAHLGQIAPKVNA